MLNTISTNYELSKKLKELGFNQETELYWANEQGEKGMFLYVKTTWSENPKHIKAYTLEQLINAMPAMISGAQFLSVWNDGVGYFENESIVCHPLDVSFLNDNNDDSLADCAAKCLIKLHEEKEIDLKSVKSL